MYCPSFGYLECDGIGHNVSDVVRCGYFFLYLVEIEELVFAIASVVVPLFTEISFLFEAPCNGNTIVSLLFAVMTLFWLIVDPMDGKLSALKYILFSIGTAFCLKRIVFGNRGKNRNKQTGPTFLSGWLFSSEYGGFFNSL